MNVRCALLAWCQGPRAAQQAQGKGAFLEPTTVFRLAGARTCDAVVCLGRIAPDALLGAADGVCEQCVDARVLTELGREASPAGGAGLLALAQPALEAAQAEVVLAWTLQETAGTRTDAHQGSVHMKADDVATAVALLAVVAVLFSMLLLTMRTTPLA